MLENLRHLIGGRPMNLFARNEDCDRVSKKDTKRNEKVQSDYDKVKARLLRSTQALALSVRDDK